ncbi:23S rRNA (uracil(1939)-C(5))-methyltransferase RlmD [Allofustis seminis]|uniref:23S rRNA (uracil(1939)-C(5))-methyltransferase RlmD n=1 Tax=Allofustis seminis TaxID=166939 RepID=UPI000377C8C8|nr:23S rRNA (uracil(1939)-C(5))-methyltransferase RlmD [Allofustis seminis]
MRTVTFKVGDILSGEVTDLSHIGEGVLHIDGFPIFVAQALVGEHIQFEIDHIGQHRAFGHVIRWLSKSPDRVEIADTIYEETGTMPLQHLAYHAQLEFKQHQVQKLFKTVAQMPHIEVKPTIGMEDPYAYRNKAQIPIRMVDGQLTSGFYRRKSHDLLPMENFIIQEPEIDRAIIVVRDILRAYQVPAYDEYSHSGVVRHLIVRRGHYTQQLMLVLVTNGQVLPHAAEIVSEIIKQLPEVVSIIQNINEEKTNVILGRQSMVLYGQDYYNDQLCGHTFNISHQSFYQVNTIQTEKLYKKAIEFAQLTAQDIVVDAYCGIGTMTLAFAEKAKHVYGVEIVRDAIENAKENATMNQIKNVTFTAKDAGQWMVQQKNKGLRPNVIVVDPPRKGLDRKFIDAALHVSPDRIVYVSCNPATLARDVKIITDSNLYEVKEIQPVDMFPQTHHVETVVLMSRVDK